MCLTFGLCHSVKKKGFQYHFWYQKPFGCSLLPRAVTNYTIWCGSSAKGAALFAKQSVNLLAPNLNDHDLALFDFDFRLIPAADDFLNRPNFLRRHSDRRSGFRFHRRSLRYVRQASPLFSPARPCNPCSFGRPTAGRKITRNV